MKEAIYSFISIKPRRSFLLSIVSLFLLICGFFFFGTYIDSPSSSWWVALILFLGLLLLTAPAFVFQCFFYFSKPKLILGRKTFGRGFILLVSIMLACLLTFLVDLPFYFVDNNSWQANGSFGPLGLCFGIIALVVLCCVGGGYKDTFSEKNSQRSCNPDAPSSDFSKRINEFMPWFLCTYFLLIVLPYSFALVPAVNSFFTGLFTKLAFRGFTCLYFLVYSILLSKANRKSLNFSWLVILCLLIVCYIIAWACVPTTYVYYTTTFERGLTFHWTELGQLNNVVSLSTFVTECIMFLCLVSFFPFGVISRKAIIYPLIVVVFYALFGCLFSFAKDGSLYIDTLRGLAVEKNAIRSIFHSKNAFGIFLFLGCFCSLFLIWYLKKGKWVFFCTNAIFLITSAIIKCYTAFIPGLIISVVLLVTLLFKLRSKHKLLFSVIVTILLVTTVTVLTLTYIPDARSHSKILASLYANLENISSGEILSRTKLWDYSLSLIHGPFVILGETDAVANSQLVILEQISNDSTYADFHNAFVSFYTGFGLSGLVAYLGLHAYSLKKIHFIRAVNRDVWMVSLVLFFGAVLFSMPETYTLFLNMSAAVFPINLILLVFPRFLSIGDNNALAEKAGKEAS